MSGTSNGNHHSNGNSLNDASYVATVPRDRPIAVIGAGVAGVATAVALQTAGYTNFVVYEKNAGLGGLWLQNYPGASVQTTPHQYEYPGYLYPDEIRNRKNPPTPTALEVRNYLTHVCQSVGVLDRFQFETTVGNIRKLDSGTWTIDVQPKVGKKRTETFDFVIICTGLFSNTPNVLNIPGSEEYVRGGGRILHTSEWSSLDEFEKKNVLVIGNGKSAADAAVAAAAVAEKHHTTPPIQAIRKQNWYVPRFLLNFKCLFHSRLVSALLPRYYEETSLLSKVLHTVFYPVKYILWRALELLFLLLLRLPYKVWPTLGTIDSEGSLSVPLLVTDERHLGPVRRGAIDLRICEVRQLFATKHARLSTGVTVPVDVLVMGTGWKLDYSFFHTSILSKLDFTYDGLWLYRNMLAPTVPGLAFIGANTLTFMNMYTAYVQAFWLVGLLTGTRAPPSVADMLECMAREKEFKRRLYPQCALRGATIEAFMQHYHDLLFAEQGITPFLYTGPFGWFWNIFVPILPETMAPSFERVHQFYAVQQKKA